jgi:hypothetical protein
MNYININYNGLDSKLEISDNNKDDITFELDDGNMLIISKCDLKDLLDLTPSPVQDKPKCVDCIHNEEVNAIECVYCEVIVDYKNYYKR